MPRNNSSLKAHPRDTNSVSDTTQIEKENKLIQWDLSAKCKCHLWRLDRTYCPECGKRVKTPNLSRSDLFQAGGLL